jgi:gluconokinase
MVILVMGVTGSGKTTVGTLLAKKLAWAFLDADDFHSPANRQKMHLGIPLTDADRLPWLASIHDELLRRSTRGENIVLACSALRQSYRELLSGGLQVALVYLRGTAEELHRNLAARTHHFAGESLVPSQLETLEEPSDALAEDIAQSPEQLVTSICARLKLC